MERAVVIGGSVAGLLAAGSSPLPAAAGAGS